MPNHKVKLIVNPNADLGRAWHKAADLRPVVDEFGGADWTGTVYPTHATELAYQAALDGYEIIIAAGGDGTAHEVINGLMKVPAEQRPKLGVVPIGSGNDFSYAVGMNPQPEIAMRQILTGTPRLMDVGMVKDNRGRLEYWDNTVGIGFDATVTIRSRNFTVVRGFLIYLFAVLQTILLNHDAPRFTIKSDNEEFSSEMLMFVLCNGGREGGGFQVHPYAKADDGILNYVGINRVSRPMMLRLVPEVMKGTHPRFQQVRMGKFTEMHIQANKSLVIHMDGEIFAGFGVDVHELHISILPQAIQILA